ncbi:MAG: WbqC family protein [Candidatus Omnitrophota bacterium]
MKCVILQPSYIPWRGYFHQIQKADVFVFYDDVQYDHRGWRNRNRIKTPDGTKWLTVPVRAKGHQTEKIPIRDIRVAWDDAWNAKHWKALVRAYAKAPFFNRYAPLLESFYAKQPDLLADFTIDFTMAIAKELGFGGKRFTRSSELNGRGAKTGRLVNILKTVGASHYISGPSARGYLDEKALEREGIILEYMDYRYPEYPQLYPPFDPQVSVLDLLFMTGPDAPAYIRG